ncbi:MAG: CotH kinase family protein [Clostridia bacterium]|nr:CotH kinase family protein [Clostridia bacterium]
MKKNFIRLLIFMLTAVLIAGAFGCEKEDDDPSNPSGTYQPGMTTDEKFAANYQSLLKGDTIINVAITISDAYYAEILAAPEDETYYSADIKIGTDTVSKIGLRTSGNTDLSEFEDNSQSRYSYKVKFDKYVDKQKYVKLDEMYLLNLKSDPSYMRAYLAYSAFREIGGNSPLCSYANLSINGTSQGLYLAVEAVDDAFLKRVFGDNDGVNLYKAAEGADLLSTASLALLDQKNGDDETKTDLQQLIQILNEMPEGEKGDIESILDVDSALRYIAVCTGLGIYKSYLSKNPDNYYLAVKEGKFYIFPWNVNSAFGAAGKDNGVSVDISPYEPVYRTSMYERPLVSKLLAVDEYVTKYEGYVTAVREYLDGIEAKIETLDKLISESVKSDTTGFYSYDQYLVAIGKSEPENNTTGIIAMQEYATLRRDFLKSLNF